MILGGGETIRLLVRQAEEVILRYPNGSCCPGREAAAEVLVFIVTAGKGYLQSVHQFLLNLRNYDVLGVKTVPGDRNTPSYNGVNVYGDQIGSASPQVNIRSTLRNAIYQQVLAQLIANNVPIAQAQQQAAAIAASQSSQLFATNSDSIVSRTGYAERDLVDYNTYNFKMNGGLYYKIRPNTELSLVGF